MKNIHKCIYYLKVGYVWFSNYGSAETPFNVIGINKHTGLEGTSKDICKDRKIGTR